MGELLKMPFLGAHYLEHQHRNPKIGVMEFLSMHYWGTDLKDNDQQKDMKLPFKKILHQSHHTLFQSAFKTVCLQKPVYLLKPFFTDPANFLLHPSLEKPYRPPQVHIDDLSGDLFLRNAFFKA